VDGVVEEIGLTYTLIRTRDDARLVVPNEKLVSDTIRNSSIGSRGTFAEITVQVPLSADLRAAVDGLQEEVAGERSASVFVSALDGDATVTIRAAANDEETAQRLESDLRVRVQGRLRALGAWG
jgi:small-conductance mechanosensitive channel